MSTIVVLVGILSLSGLVGSFATPFLTFGEIHFSPFPFLVLFLRIVLHIRERFVHPA